MADALVDFLNAIAAEGLSPPKSIIADGKLHRFASDNSRQRDDAGWYFLHPDDYGAFGCWRLDIKKTWCSKSRTGLTDAEKAELDGRIADAKKARDEVNKEVRAEARSRAMHIWDRLPMADSEHPYLDEKKVRPHGIRRDRRQDRDLLVVPIRDIDGTLHDLEFIAPDGKKRLLKGAAKKGNFHLIGTVHASADASGTVGLSSEALAKEDVVAIAEGYATGASVHEVTGYPVAVAFDAANLVPVAETIRKKCPDCLIIIAGDNDKSGVGQDKARAAAAASGGKELIPERPSDWPDDWNSYDWNDAHGREGLEAVKAAFDAAIAAARKPVDEVVSAAGDISETPAMDKAITKGNGSAGRRPKQADILIGLARTAHLFHSPDSTGYADLEINGHRETWPIRAKGFRRWLARQFFKATGGAPSSEALQSALNVIEAKAHFDGPEWIVQVRVGGFEDRIYLDLVDEKWRAVEIDASGWRVVDNPPVRFRRTSGMKPLPIPTTGGSIETLRSFLNVQSDADFVLAVAWALAGLRNRGPYPVMVLSGEQGSAKSTFCATLRALIDPNTAPLRALPREDRDLFIAANNGHVLAFDNVSGLSGWISDTLCRLATGGGFAVRQLYTDQDEILFDATRPAILNGIEDFVTRPDLADRAIILTLEPIPEERRRPEAELWAAFEAERPRILGALLDAVAKGLEMLPKTKLKKLPRMADFALWGVATETAFWQTGTFLRAYQGNRNEAVEAVIDADPIALALRMLMASRSEWQGTASQLLATLSEIVGERVTRSKTWPDNHSALGSKVRRAATFLRRTGIKIDFFRHGRSWTIHLAKDTLSTAPENTGNLPSPPSFASPQSQHVNPANGLAGDGMVTAPVTGMTAVAPPAVTTMPLIANDGDSDDGSDSKLPPQSAPGNASTDAFDDVFAAVEEPETWESEL